MTRFIGKKTHEIDTVEEISWNQWLAGIIDGDGYFNIGKNKVAVCEITMPLQDEPLLAQIKQKLGGRLSPRSGSKAVRYRLAHKAGMIDLIDRVNGFIRNSIRVNQFKTICQHFNKSFLEPKPLTKNDGYIAGFFDADGSICLNIAKTSASNSIKSGMDGKIQRLIDSRGYHCLEVSISNKYKKNLIFFQQAFGFGTIRSVGNGKYKTHVYFINLCDIAEFIDYTKKFPLRSAKRKRVWALKQYFELKQMKAHLALEGTVQHKAWSKFCTKWYS
uniref:Putative LAGLIDADG homing endonuclease n=1 Tax=Sykidion marinum TaxID=44573 RepID=A0A1W6EGN5_SYKMA|nr:putative LAGLIDADG homing endonuclease [Pseudoneochloris marina]ARK14545.1 putative LAGLIDADG homing endonuclease [Pseudoneochloris marina]